MNTVSPEDKGVQSEPPGNKRKLLITISEQKEHLLGLQFVSRFLRKRDLLTLELFYMLPLHNAPQLGLYGTPMHKSKMEPSIYEMHLERAAEAIKEARQKLIGFGFAADQIGEKYEPPSHKDDWSILDEVNRGHFDAVIVGNRGRSWLESALGGDVDLGDELLHASCAAPLWICAKPVDNAANVLLCLDGSDMSFRMTQHVGRMLQNEPAHNVTLFRVKRSNPASTMTPEEIFAQGTQILTETGLSNDRINSLIVENSDVVQAIIDEAEKSNYAVIAAGRSGSGKGLLEKVFMGSVTEKIFKKLKERALWVQC